MSCLKNTLNRLTMPAISNNRDFMRYVLLVNAFGLAVALTADIAQQMMFFSTWETALRSWLVTVFVVGVIATPVAVVFARAARELQSTKRALEEISRTDALTGLPNRRALMEAGEAPESQGMVLVIADIDHFKEVNDTHGHRVGDAVLQTVGRIMAAHLAGYGMTGRLGGEEFALVAPRASVERIVPALSALLRLIATTPIVTPGGAVHVTLSAGIAVHYASEPFERLYADADEALYLAKRSGRNRLELSARAEEALMFGRGVSVSRA